jgi:hypothetical protein
MVGERSEPGDATAYLSDLGRSKKRNQGSGCWSAERHGRNAWRDRDGYEQAARHSDRQSGCEESDDDPKRKSGKDLYLGDPRTAIELDADAIVDAKHKARANQRDCADCHEPNDVELQGLGH